MAQYPERELADQSIRGMWKLDASSQTVSLGRLSDCVAAGADDKCMNWVVLINVPLLLTHLKEATIASGTNSFQWCSLEH